MKLDRVTVTGADDSAERLAPREVYRRLEDMSPDGWLGVLIEDDGDVIVSVYQPRNSIDGPIITSVQFCTEFGGGGQSPKVREAILNLAKAIKAENNTRPQHRGEF